MWQDDFISKRDGSYICWDAEGEFVALCSDLESARATITEYSDTIKRKRHEQFVPESFGFKRKR